MLEPHRLHPVSVGEPVRLPEALVSAGRLRPQLVCACASAGFLRPRPVALGDSAAAEPFRCGPSPSFLAFFDRATL